MKLVSLASRIAICVTLAANPLAAEDSENGLSLMEEGALLFFKGLQQQMEPALEGLEELQKEVGPALRLFAEEMGPALGQLLNEVEDWSAYHPPEFLSNGDIIIRRKSPSEENEALENDTQTDL